MTRTDENGFCAPLLMRWALLGRRSGAIVVSGAAGGPLLGTVHVRDGRVVFLTSAERDPRPGERHAEFIAERIARLCELRDAAAAFDPSSVAAASEGGLSIPALLVGAMRRVGEQRAREWAGDRDELLVATGDLYAPFAGGPLADDERALISRLGRAASARDLEAAAEPATALRLVCALRFANLLVPAGPPRPWVGYRDPFPASAGEPEARAAAALDIPEAARVCFLVERKLADLDAGADLYTILEVERRTPAERIRASYRELAKQFHPDRHSQLAAYDPDIKARLERIFATLNAAYSVLASAAEREAYDAKLGERALRGSVRVPPPGPDPQPAPPKKRSAARPAPAGRRAAGDRPRESGPPPARAAEDAPAPSAPAAPQLEAAGFRRYGTEYYRRGEFERAVLAFRKGLALAPNDASLHAGLARALLRHEGFSRQVEAALHRAIELEPLSVERLVELADVYVANDRDEDALILIKRVLRIDPGNAEARQALSMIDGAEAPGFLDRFLKK